MARADRRGAQLAFELSRELLERLRAHAAAERRTVAAVLRGWIEAGLAGALEPSAEPSAALVGLANRVEALERDVAQLQLGAIKATKRRERPEPPLPAVKVSEMSDSGGCPPDPPAAGGQLRMEIIGAKHLQEPPASPDRVIPAPPVGDAITTAKLAERTGTNRAAWNNWAAADRIGEVRAHPQAGSWRLVGKAPAPGGGPERWLWEPA